MFKNIENSWINVDKTILRQTHNAKSWNAMHARKIEGKVGVQGTAIFLACSSKAQTMVTKWEIIFVRKWGNITGYKMRNNTD